MQLLVGIVGKPSSGKSSFFSAATMIEVAIAPYPFTTIKPNHAVGFVRTECAEKNFGVKCNPVHGYCIQGVRFVPVELLDVAGLVPGSHAGKGMGNQFLDDLRQADALVHVVDASGSTDSEGKQVENGSHDVCFDVLFLEEEINLWFEKIVEKNFAKIVKLQVKGKSELVQLLSQTLSGLGVSEKEVEKTLKSKGLEEKKLGDWSAENVKEFAVKVREISKPIIIAANKCDLPEAREKIKELKEKFPEKTVISCSALAELTLKKAAKEGFIEYLPGSKSFEEMKGKELSEKQKKGLQYIKENVLEKFESTGVQECLEKAVFEVLEMIAVFPVPDKSLKDVKGNILPDCYLLKKGSTALDLAFKIHQDIGKGFVKAIDLKTKQAVGKEHELKQGDVIEIIFKK